MSREQALRLSSCLGSIVHPRLPNGFEGAEVEKLQQGASATSGWSSSKCTCYAAVTWRLSCSIKLTWPAPIKRTATRS